MSLLDIAAAISLARKPALHTFETLQDETPKVYELQFL